jgi:hypothetical protein
MGVGVRECQGIGGKKDFTAELAEGSRDHGEFSDNGGSVVLMELGSGARGSNRDRGWRGGEVDVTGWKD